MTLMILIIYLTGVIKDYYVAFFPIFWNKSYPNESNIMIICIISSL